MKTDTPDKLLLSAPQVAASLGISRSTLYELSYSGKIGPQPVHLGRCVRWRADELTKWIAAGCPHRQKWAAMRGAR